MSQASAIAIIIWLANIAMPNPANAAPIKCIKSQDAKNTLSQLKQASDTYYSSELKNLDSAQINFLISLVGGTQECLVTMGEAKLSGTSGVLIRGSNIDGTTSEAFCWDQTLSQCQVRTYINGASSNWSKGRIEAEKLGIDFFAYTVVEVTGEKKSPTYYAPSLWRVNSQ